MRTVVFTRVRRPVLVAFLRSLPAVLAGRLPDPHGIAAAMRARIAWTFFSLVAISFDLKGRGGRNGAGDSWPPNTRAYLAYQKGRPAGVVGQGRVDSRKKPAHRTNRRAHLTPEQFRRWGVVYRAKLRQMIDRAPIAQARGEAATAAWAATRGTTADTLISQYGGQEDTMLVDRGDLRRSVQPGEILETVYRPSDGQTFEEPTGQIVLASKDRTAAFHHRAKRLTHADPGKGTVRRRLWPESLPDSWIDEILAQAIVGISLLVRAVERGDIR